MPYLKIFIHAVWATKNREPLMNTDNKDALCSHIREYTQNKNIQILSINGWQDHIHCLISLSSDQNMATVMNLIKGESSHWANKHLNWKGRFGWQSDYFAVSVSPSQVKRVSRYIVNQEEHHRQKSFQEEYTELLRHFGLQQKG